MGASSKALLVIVALALSPPADGETSQRTSACLPPAAGEVVSGLMQSGKLAELVPPPFDLESANIPGNELILRFAGRGAAAEVVLRPPDSPAADRQGRWFSFSFAGSSPAVLQKARGWLLDVAREVDAAFDASPWIACKKPEPTRARERPFPWPVVTASLLLAALLALAVWQRRACTGILRAFLKTTEKHHWPVLLAMLLPMAVARFASLDIPFDGDYATQRIFFASLDLPDILLHRYEDSRHPQLFYLILHAFLWLGHGEWVARLPAAILSLGTLACLFVFTRPLLGARRALVAVLLLGLSDVFLFHSREVSDVALFTFLALLSSHLLLRCLEKPRTGLVAAFAVFEICMLYSYYMAVVVLCAHAVALLLHGRKPGRRALWIGAGLALLISLPVLWSFSTTFVGDMATRRVAGQYPHHVWGAREPVGFLAELAGLLFPEGGWGLLAGCLAAAGALRLGVHMRHRPAGALLGAIAMQVVAIVFVGVFLVRLKPYYLLFVLPFIELLIVEGVPRDPGSPPGGSGKWRRPLRVMATAALLALVVVQSVRLAARLPGHYVSRGRDLYVKLAERVEAGGGADTVIADPNFMHTILLYYLFPDPLDMYRTCERAPGGAKRCELNGRRMITLTSLPRMKPGWQERAVRSFDTVSRDYSWFVYTESFSNPALLSHLGERCRREGHFEHLILFRCPPAPTDVPDPGR